MPEDVYQCAKVSKILQMMEKGNTANFKDKCLDEIDVNMDEIEDYLLEEEDGKGRMSLVLVSRNSYKPLRGRGFMLTTI